MHEAATLEAIRIGIKKPPEGGFLALNEGKLFGFARFIEEISKLRHRHR